MKFEKNVDLKEFTTFKIGGPAEYFFKATTEEDLTKAIKKATKEELPVFVIGGGSNILISDQGIKGLVIKCEIKGIEFSNNIVKVGAGVNINELIGQASDKGLGGLEFLAGVPSTVGGAIWGNAGSHTESIGDLVKTVKVLDGSATQASQESKEQIRELTRSECQFGYRDSIFKHDELIILEVVFELKEVEGIKEKVAAQIAKKGGSQDLKNPSAGCVFKNPVGDKGAGQIIDELGLKGYEMGGAKVSTKHANFIINSGEAKAEDVIMLISYIKQQVRDNTGIELQEEIQYIGFDN